jgi:hypothetical protein
VDALELTHLTAMSDAGSWPVVGDARLARPPPRSAACRMCQVSFLEGRLATVVRVLLVVGTVVAFWRWSSLSWHARGLILAADGAMLLLVVLLSALRLRVKGRGTVVGVEQRTGPSERPPNHLLSPEGALTTPDGRTVVFTSAFGSTSKPDVGAFRRVRYRLADPEHAEVVSAATWLLGRLQSCSGWGCFWWGRAVPAPVGSRQWLLAAERGPQQALPALPAVARSIDTYEPVAQRPRRSPRPWPDRRPWRR